MRSVSPDEFVRFLGTPADMYWESVCVLPVRARSKSFAARSRAAGGRSSTDCGFVGFDVPFVVSGGGLSVGMVC